MACFELGVPFDLFSLHQHNHHVSVTRVQPFDNPFLQSNHKKPISVLFGKMKKLLIISEQGNIRIGGSFFTITQTRFLILRRPRQFHGPPRNATEVTQFATEPTRITFNRSSNRLRGWFFEQGIKNDPETLSKKTQIQIQSKSIKISEWILYQRRSDTETRSDNTQHTWNIWNTYNNPNL